MQLKLSTQSGFTLVELAIALMVIGLLITGVLKGIELVSNARIIQTAKQIQDIRTSVVAFESMYGALPGDILNPTRKLPSCTTDPCQLTGDNNRRIDFTTDGHEPMNFWAHLAVTGLVKGTDVGSSTQTNYTYRRFTLSPRPPLNATYFYDTRYYLLNNKYSNRMVIFGGNSTTGPLNVVTPNEASQLDRKTDDGAPNTGDIMSLNGTGTCITGSNTYVETDTDSTCIFYIDAEL